MSTTLNLSHYISIARLGDTIDGAVVTATAHPDNDPAENWSSLGCVQNYKNEQLTEAGPKLVCVDASGTRIEYNDDLIVGRRISFETDATNALALELAHGTAGAIVDGVTVAGDAKVYNHIEIWIKDESLNLITKVTHSTQNIYGIIKLQNAEDIRNGAARTAKYIFERRGMAEAPIRFGAAPVVAP